jgi:hypothetical protein
MQTVLDLKKIRIFNCSCQITFIETSGILDLKEIKKSLLVTMMQYFVSPSLQGFCYLQ